MSLRSRMRTGLVITAALLAGVASGCGVKPVSEESASIVYAVAPESVGDRADVGARADAKIELAKAVAVPEQLQ